MILYFENRFGARREIGRPQSASEAHKLIQDFLDKANYKSYYSRTHRTSNKKEIEFDVGSHSEFFYLYKEDGWNDNWIEELYERS